LARSTTRAQIAKALNQDIKPCCWLKNALALQGARANANPKTTTAHGPLPMLRGPLIAIGAAQQI